MKRLFAFAVAAAAALCWSSVWAADPPAVAPEEKIPIIELPPEPVNGVQKYDPAAVKVRDLPYHVTLSKAPEAWAKNPAAKGKGIKVAIVDTWGQPDHPGFHGQVKGSYSAITKKENPPRPPKPNPHCTHCAGIVHAILPEADLYLIEGMNSGGSGTTADLAHGIDYAVSTYKVDVVSCSFGGSSKDPYLPAAIKRAQDAGVLVLAAAGNDGGPGDTEGYPARYDGATSVAACDSKRQLASFSSWGPNVYTVKPGVDITSLLPDNQEGEMSGTSMATPCEAGCAGSWLASNHVPKDKDRTNKYRSAVLAASPFPERNNARGHGMYTLDKITGETKTPPPGPVKPPAAGTTVQWSDLTKEAQERLLKQGVGNLQFHIGPPTAEVPASSPPIPVMKSLNAEPSKPAVDYTEYLLCQERVSAGGVAMLAVGVKAEPHEYRTESLPGIAPGRYRCFSENGKPMMERVIVHTPGGAASLVTTVGQPLLMSGCANGQCRPVQQGVIGRWR